MSLLLLLRPLGGVAAPPVHGTDVYLVDSDLVLQHDDVLTFAGGRFLLVDGRLALRLSGILYERLD